MEKKELNSKEDAVHHHGVGISTFGSLVELGSLPSVHAPHQHPKFDEDDFATPIDPPTMTTTTSDDGFGFADSYRRRPTFTTRKRKGDWFTMTKLRKSAI